MSGSTTTSASRAEPVGRGLRLSGVLLVAGLLVNTIATAGFHPSGDEDDHEKIFTDYAESSGWEAVHIAQFIGGLLVIAGLIALYRALATGDGPAMIARFGAAAAVGYSGLDSDFQSILGMALLVAVLVFSFGLLVAGGRAARQPVAPS